MFRLLLQVAGQIVNVTTYRACSFSCAWVISNTNTLNITKTSFSEHVGVTGMARRTHLKAQIPKKVVLQAAWSIPLREDPNKSQLHQKVEGGGRKKDVLTERTLYSVFHDLPILFWNTQEDEIQVTDWTSRLLYKRLYVSDQFCVCGLISCTVMRSCVYLYQQWKPTSSQNN